MTPHPEPLSKDIVARLRQVQGDNDDAREAADTIERMRAALQLAADHLEAEGYTIEADMARRALEPEP